ncbi:MAG: hypothetical protein PHG48_05230 [Eubacteriales bacterium]|nr:hypothetical protein [Eubacteriales bacterium]
MSGHKYVVGDFVLDTGSGLTLMSKGECGKYYADIPYTYSVSVKRFDDAADFSPESSAEYRPEMVAECTDGGIMLQGLFGSSGIQIEQCFYSEGGNLCEVITLTNKNSCSVELDDIRLGFTADISDTSVYGGVEDETGKREKEEEGEKKEKEKESKGGEERRLCAIPLRVQLDGSIHDYTDAMLREGTFSNAAHPAGRRLLPELTEKGILRSEAWAWGSDEGIVIAKYSNDEVELSVARPEKTGLRHMLTFGGAGFCLYGEPGRGKRLKAGESYTFAPTVYMRYEGGVNNAFYAYRSFICGKGHGFPVNYNPPVNWNVLYDTGWHHSNPEMLKKYYTRDAILKQAGYAAECGCELLYLDPGWETAEGLTIWDEARLGDPAGLVSELKGKYGLDLGYRTILFAHHKYDIGRLWPPEYKVELFPDKAAETAADPDNKYLRGICAVNDRYLEEKLNRIIKITSQGVKFMMFDEMDWCGPCHSSRHSHDRPASSLDHINAIYGLVSEVKQRCPRVLVEVHDPIWPWTGCNYVPTYFRQGFATDDSRSFRNRCYEEKWGFEFMWNCINDLKTGKAMSLYYYNLGSNVPLYLHITMASDNDNCLFFWWAASTVRHLGIGGKNGHVSVNPPGLPPYDKEKRYDSYIRQMKIYKSLKPYFVRGIFTGIAENIHLHTLQESAGGVVSVFNLTEEPAAFDFDVSYDNLGSFTGKGKMEVMGADAEWLEYGVRLHVSLPPMSPGLVVIGNESIYF